jgi:two-component system, chemotaxis family, protein-glutamate methylesterase/glutaminase
VSARELVVFGVSAGGLEAMTIILRGLTAALPLALVVVQHRSKDSTALCDLLQDASPLPVGEATDKEPIELGRVYVAPADYHLLIEPDRLALSLDEPELYSRPSIDLCFETAAHSFGARAVGVVLTGANADGSRGLRRIVARGGYAIVQDPATAEVPVMPQAAIEAVPEAKVLPLDRIAAHLAELPTAPDARGASRTSERARGGGRRR